MTILALEFSSPQRSVALARDGVVLASAFDTGDPRVTNAFGLIEKVLVQSGLAREEIELIAVGLGPGSYTGIRAAIALAQGWHLARGVKLAGVSSVEAIAARARTDGLFGQANIIVDAQRGEFYMSIWDISADRNQELSALKIVPDAEIKRLLAAGQRCIGPVAEQVVFPDAASVALLAGQRADSVPGKHLEPIYLRETSFVKVTQHAKVYQAGQ